MNVRHENEVLEAAAGAISLFTILILLLFAPDLLSMAVE